MTQRVVHVEKSVPPWRAGSACLERRKSRLSGVEIHALMVKRPGDRWHIWIIGIAEVGSGYCRYEH